MGAFIARRIMLKADSSKENGVEKYKAYFVKTQLYKNYREDVDATLRAKGYYDVIV